jgi:hypothetical protein
MVAHNSSIYSLSLLKSFCKSSLALYVCPGIACELFEMCNFLSRVGDAAFLGLGRRGAGGRGDCQNWPVSLTLFTLDSQWVVVLEQWKLHGYLFKTQGL